VWGEREGGRVEDGSGGGRERVEGEGGVEM
jgi:hypothetical protein